MTLMSITCSEKGDKRCEFLPPKQEDYKMLDFRDQILVRDQKFVLGPLLKVA